MSTRLLPNPRSVDAIAGAIRKALDSPDAHCPPSSVIEQCRKEKVGAAYMAIYQRLIQGDGMSANAWTEVRGALAMAYFGQLAAAKFGSGGSAPLRWNEVQRDRRKKHFESTAGYGCDGGLQRTAIRSGMPGERATSRLPEH